MDTAYFATVLRLFAVLSLLTLQSFVPEANKMNESSGEKNLCKNQTNVGKDR